MITNAFSQIDLSRLAAPDVVEVLDYEVILAEMLADLRARDSAFTALTEADPAYKILEVAAYRELLIRQRINEAARSVMLAYAAGADLDQIAANFGVARLLIRPADDRTIPPTPAVYETDEELRTLKAMANPLDEVARRAAERYAIICFDEFHISDIADAMILERLLHAFFQHRLVFVMTSNYVPDALYPDGLHRDAILPAIALLNRNLDVMSVDVGTDYRQLTIKGVPAYLSPLSDANRAAMEAAFARLSDGAEISPELIVENRPLRAVRCADEVVWFDFDTLCRTARSQNDYLDIASRFDTVMLSDVPQMDSRMASEARRFTWLIDVLYDQKVNLVISAEVPPDQLYTSGAMAHEFVRTASRLHEMQSDTYRNEARRAQADRLG